MDLQEWKNRCPYGRWTCADGREVLFNRQYWPILERRPGEQARPANPGEWIEHIVTHDYFFDDWTSPWRHPWNKRRAETLATVNQVLIEWGFPALGKPPKAKLSSKLVFTSKVDFLSKPIPPRKNPYMEPS